MQHKTVYALLAINLLLSPICAIANDSTATLGTGGLEFTKSTAIQMTSEDLLIAPHQIKIDYVFENTSDNDITTTVAFPMPAIPAGVERSPMDFPVKDTDGVLPDNFVKFKTTINTQDIPMQHDNIALLENEDVTQILKDYGLKIEPRLYTNINLETYKKMSQEKLKHLQDIGLIFYDAEMLHSTKPDDYEYAVNELWSVQPVFHWEQTFPAHQALRVHHEYEPVYGTSVPFPVDTLLSKSLGYTQEFCIDTPTKRGLKKAFKTQDVNPAIVDYILTTGANWQGPIKHFKLTLDKEAEDNYISTCVDGLQKISPTQFQVSKTNFTPTQNLHILVVSKKGWYRD